MNQSGPREITFTPPMECLPVDHLPDGPGWVYELKLDGYRGQAIRDRGGLRLLSRNGKDLSKRFSAAFSALNEALPLPVGELVAFDESGQPSFNAIQNTDAETNVVFFVFDVLFHQWKGVKLLPLSERLTLLRSAFTPTVTISKVRPFPPSRVGSENFGPLHSGNSGTPKDSQKR
jgi:bifunctional non-homologous end joining protein LigD